MKILFQRLWERKIDWDDPVPLSIQSTWEKWRCELPQLVEKTIPRCYYPKEVTIVSKQLHGFSNASEEAYAAVVYLRMIDMEGNVHTSLVTSKTKVSPIKKLTIPCLELCGALLLSRLLNHVRGVFEMSVSHVHAWTDSTIVLCWLSGNPRRFKTFVGNRVAAIIDSIPPGCWRHIAGSENPADCASRGLYPSELINHPLWWNGPNWLKNVSSEWPEQPKLLFECSTPESAVEVCHITMTLQVKPVLIIAPDRYSIFERLRRIVAWSMRFITNCRCKRERHFTSYLTTSELYHAEAHIFSAIQAEQFSSVINLLKTNQPVPRGNCLLPLSPFVDSSGLIRVGGRQRLGHLSSSKKHPIILYGSHPIVKLIITQATFTCRINLSNFLTWSEVPHHSNQNHCSVYYSSVYHLPMSVSKAYTTNNWTVATLTPGPVFERTGVDYAGPIYINYGHVRKPVIVKSYVSVFVSLSVKAIHLELVTDLTSDAFISCLRRFIARRGYPSLIWSDHGTNFVGANREIKELIQHLNDQKTQKDISEFCTFNNIEWKLIPEHSPHFGGIWEAAVKSFKRHLRRIVGEVTLTFEEMYTVLTQIEACLNSRPLVSINNDSDGIEVLTPGHFLIG